MHYPLVQDDFVRQEYEVFYERSRTTKGATYSLTYTFVSVSVIDMRKTLIDKFLLFSFN